MDLRTCDRRSSPVSPDQAPLSAGSSAGSDQSSSSAVAAAAAAAAAFAASCSNTSSAKKCINRQSQRCSVCSDRAYYVFYGAVACDSCRTFFRRQVLHSKDLSCHFNNSCQIQQNTRKDCASCRLDKCLAVGMKKSLVAVGEAEGSRSSSLQQPAAANDVLLCRSRSVCEIPHAPAQTSVHVSETRVSGTAIMRGSGSLRDASFPSFCDGRSDDDAVQIFGPSRCSPFSYSPVARDDYHCHQQLRRSYFSRIPLNSYLSMSDSCDGVAATSQISLQRNCLPPSTQHKQISCSQGIRNDAVHGREASRVPVREEGLNQPRPHPKIAYKKEQADLSTAPRAKDPLTTAGPEAERTSSATDSKTSSPEPEQPTRTLVLRKLVHPKFRKSPPVSLTITIGNDPEKVRGVQVTGLSSTERMRFMEILNATRTVDTGVGTNFRKQSDEIRQQEKETSFVPLVILICAKTLLAIAEKLAVFDLLPRQDKENLLKGSLTEILFLRSAKFFNRSSQCWIFGSGGSTHMIPDIVPINVLRVAGDDVYEKYSQFVSTFDSAVYDDVICNLMSVICFFTERSEPLLQKSHISSERSLYLRLLKRYLEAKYGAGSKLSPAHVFANIQEKLHELTSIKEMYEKSNVDLENIDQLVVNYQQMRLGSSPSLTDESPHHEDGTTRASAHTLTSTS